MKRLKKLNIDKMRRHQLRDVPDEIVKFFPEDARTRDFNVWIKPWMRKIEAKHKGKNFRIQVSQKPYPFDDTIMVSALVVFITPERTN